MQKARFLPAIAALLFTLAGPPADAADRAAEPAPGQLLVASAVMRDPRFHHSVILLVRHDDSGAFGIAINNLLGERPIADLLRDAVGGTAADQAIEGTIPVFLGGPVERRSGFVVHSTDYHRPETLAVGEIAAMTATIDILRDIGHRHGPRKFLFALGYAGWAAGQLEGEIARRDWFTAPADPGLIFDDDRGSLWQRALARRTREM
jgi:putative transcriptional regulator